MVAAWLAGKGGNTWEAERWAIGTEEDSGGCWAAAIVETETTQSPKAGSRMGCRRCRNW